MLKIVALNTAFLTFFLSLIACLFFQKSYGGFQFVIKLDWLPTLNLNFVLGIDGISLPFLVLTTLLIVLCILTSWTSVNTYIKEYLIIFLLLDFFLIGSFCCLDVLLFYIFFESILIPMFLLIGIWGSRNRKILAAYYFFFYTLSGSILMLISIMYLHSQVGSTNYELLLTFSFTKTEQKFLWFTFFLAFASKVPLMPFHLWLPEAHVEAPTAGSVLLAGILLKLGTYGFIRFSLPLFPYASFFFAPFVYFVSIISLIYSSFTALRQSDFKRIIAYASISHMSLVVIGIFSFNVIGLEGAVLQSLSHGFVASLLFLLIGVIYDRHATRIVQYYGGLASVMPIYVSIFLFATMANISFPGTSSFVGEFLILTGSFAVNTVITFLGAFGIILGSGYSLWVFNRISYGNLKTQHTTMFLDLNLREIVIMSPLVLGTLLVGICPNIFLNFMHSSVYNLSELLILK